MELLFCYLGLIDTEDDRLTFLHIYRKYGKQMYHIANGILKKHEAAEDAVQNAFMGIAASIDRVPACSEAAIKSYALTAARNAALAVQTEEQMWDEYLDIDKLDLCSHTDTFRTILISQDHDLLLKLMDSLPLPYREVLFMRYVLELKPQEISDILHRKPSTVHQQIYRGKQALVTLFAREVTSNA